MFIIISLVTINKIWNKYICFNFPIVLLTLHWALFTLRDSKKLRKKLGRIPNSLGTVYVIASTTFIFSWNYYLCMLPLSVSYMKCFTYWELVSTTSTSKRSYAGSKDETNVATNFSFRNKQKTLCRSFCVQSIVVDSWQLSLLTNSSRKFLSLQSIIILCQSLNCVQLWWEVTILMFNDAKIWFERILTLEHADRVMGWKKKSSHLFSVHMPCHTDP